MDKVDRQDMECLPHLLLCRLSHTGFKYVGFIHLVRQHLNFVLKWCNPTVILLQGLYIGPETFLLRQSVINVRITRVYHFPNMLPVCLLLCSSTFCSFLVALCFFKFITYVSGIGPYDNLVNILVKENNITLKQVHGTLWLMHFL